MVRTLTDSVTTTLRSGSHTLEGSTLVHEDLTDIELAFFGFALILLFPIGNG